MELIESGDKEALMERYHLVKSKNKVFYKPGTT